MALATTCPRCQTAFRVVPDQLKIRRGLVRCGNCRHVFSGLDSLRYVGDAGAPSDPTAATARPASAGNDHDPAASAVPAPITARAPLPVDPPSLSEGPETLMIVDTIATAERLDAAGPGGPIAPTSPARQHRPQPPSRDAFELEGLDEIDLRDDRSPASSGSPDPSSAPAESTAPDSEPAASAIAPAPSATPRLDALEDTPEAWSAAVLAPGHGDRPEDRPDGSPAEAVDFFAPPSRAGGFVSRANAVAALASVVLGVTLLLQLAVAGRDWLGTTVPGFEAALSAIGSSTGLTIEAPRSLEAITLESFDVHAGAAPDALVMNALLRNRAAHRVRWPAMELSLTDAGGVLIVRKVIMPDDYLPAGQARAGVPASRELPLQVALETVGIQPAGYNVKLFYP